MTGGDDSNGGPHKEETTGGSPTRQCEYAAFISYSHADRLPWGERWGHWLHRRLERFSLPGTEQRPRPESLRQRLGPVFLDRAELAADGSLSQALESHLAASHSLVVICSPRAAGSAHVGSEVSFFKSLGRSRRVYALIVSGHPNLEALQPERRQRECFHAALRFEVDPSGSVSDRPAQPVAADARWSGDGRSMALVKIVAAITGLPFDRLWRREERRRRRTMMIATTLVLLVVLTLSSLAAYAWWQRGLAEQREHLAQARLLAVRAPLLLQRQRADMDAARMLLDAWHIDRAHGSQAADEIDQGLRQVLAQPGFGGEVDLLGGLKPLSTRFDATGRWLVATGMDDIQRVFQGGPSGWQTRWERNLDGPSIRLVSSQGRVMLAIDGEGKASLGRLDPAGASLTWAPVWPWPADFEPLMLDGEDGRVLARRASDGCLRWEGPRESAPSRTAACRWRLRGESVVIAESADGKSLAIGSGQAGRILLLRKVRSAWRDRQLPFGLGEQRLQSMALDESVNGLAMGTHNGQVWWIDLSKSSAVRMLGQTEGGSINTLRVIARGQKIVAGNQEGEINLWHLSDRTRKPQVLRGHTSNVADLAYDRELGVLWSADGYGRLRRWRFSDLAAEPWLPDLLTHQVLRYPPKIHALGFEPGVGHRLMIGGDHGLLQLWNAGERDAAPAVFQLGGPAEHVMAGAFSADGQRVAAASIYGEWAVWSVAAPTSRIATTRLRKGAIPWTMTHDGERGWWLGDSQGWVTRWPDTDVAVASHRVNDALVRTVVSTAAGDLVLLAADDGKVWILSGAHHGEGGAKWKQLDLGPTEAAGGAIAASADGSMLAVGLKSGVVVLPALPPDRRTVRPFEGGFEAWSLAWSADGHWLAAGGADGVIRLWEVSALHRSPRLLSGHVAAVRVLSFSSDSRLLASGGFDNTVRVVTVKTEDLVRRTCERVRESVRAGVRTAGPLIAC